MSIHEIKKRLLDSYSEAASVKHIKIKTLMKKNLVVEVE